MKLLDDDDATAEDISNIQVNQEFARRYEHNKKREDLQRYEELKKSGRVDDDDSESDSESSADDVAAANKRKRKDIKFGDHGQDDHGNVDAKQEESKSKKRKKSMYLKDVVAKNLIEEGPEYDDVETRQGKTYNEELEELRKEFLDAVEEYVEFLKVKDKGNEGTDEVFEAKLGEYFGPKEELDDNKIKMFLMEFDADPGFCSEGDDDDDGIEEPDFDKEDELLGLPKGWDTADNEGGFASTRERFKYAKVNPNKYGLKTEDIILLEEQDLNQYLSGKVPSNQKKQYKMKVKELKNIRKASKKNDNHPSNNSEEESTSARKAKRRQNQAHLKLSHGRLLAYGKLQRSAKKSKKKV